MAVATRWSIARTSDAALPVLIATVGVGVAVGVAQFAQGPVALAMILVMSVAWFLAPVIAVVLVVRHRRGRELPSAMTLVGLGAAVVGTANLALLGLVRMVTGRDALVWNIDWRWHLNFAQTIARHADLGAALDYLGADAGYHVGPAWIAGAFQHFLGGGIDSVSFVGIPGMTGVVTFAAGTYLCTRLGSSPRVALLAAGLLLVLPTFFFDGFRLLQAPFVRNPQAFQFSARFILNGQLGWAIGIAAVALFTSGRPGLLAMGAVGVATLPAVKPQYFPGFLVAAGVVGVMVAVDDDDRRSALRRSTVALAAATVSGLVVLAGQSASDVRVAGPELHFGATGLGLREYLGAPLIVFVACVLAVARSRSARRAATLRVAVALGAAAVGVVMVLSVVQFPISAASLADARRLGFEFDRAIHQWDFGQANLPLVLIGTLSGIAGLGTLALRSRSGARALVAVGCVTALFALPLMVTVARYPMSRYAQEPAEDVGLRNVLAHVPVDGSTLVASDLADPGDHWARGLKAPLLTGYRGNQFLVSNLGYLNFHEPAAAHRLQSIQRFYGSEGWTPWHTRFVRSNGVTHVLVDDRCPPNWSTWPSELERIASSGSWTVARVRPSVPAGRSGSGGGSAADVGWRPLVQQYGSAPCLSGR